MYNADNFPVDISSTVYFAVAALNTTFYRQEFSSLQLECFQLKELHLNECICFRERETTFTVTGSKLSTLRVIINENMRQ